MGLNNFSKSLEEIIESYDDGKNDIPKELLFIDLLPIDESISDEYDPSIEDIELKPKPIKKKSIDDISKQIIQLQNSISEKLEISNGILEDQRQSLKMFRSQNMIMNTTKSEDVYDLLNSRSKLGDVSVSTEKQQTNELSTPLVIETKSENNTFITQTSQISPKFDNNKILSFDFDYDRLNKFISGSGKINLEDSEISTRLKPYLDFNNSIMVDVPVTYNILENTPDLKSRNLVVPVIYDEIMNFKDLEFKNKSIQINFDKIYNSDLPNLQPIFQDINYKLSEANLDVLVKKIEYDYLLPELTDFSRIQKIKIQTELDNRKSDIPNSTTNDILQRYNIVNEFVPRKEESVLTNQYIIKNELIEKINNITSNFSAPKSNIDTFNFEKSRGLTDQKSINEFIKNFENNNYIDLKFPQNYNYEIFHNFDIPKIDRFNSIDFVVENNVVSDGFVKTIENMSEFLGNFVEKYEKLQSYKIIDPLDQISLNSMKINEVTQEIISSVDSSKMNTMGKFSTPTMMVSTMDSKQFSLLMENLENNSNLISENIKMSRDYNNKSTNSNFISIKPVNKTEPQKDNSEKMIKLMSNLDEKMGIMISTLINMSSIMTENRNVSTSLRPHKHY